MRQYLHGFGIFKGQFFAQAHLFRGAAKVKNLLVKGKDDIGAEVTDDLPNVVIESANDRRNSNHYCNSNDDAENGERGAEFVDTDGIHGHVDNFTVITFAKHLT